MLAPIPVALDESWGLDHGTWSVLAHVYPDADIPVVQLSIDRREVAMFHFEVGRKLAPLRQEGVLIVGSGNLIHNLHAYAWGRHAAEPYEWAVRFERTAREVITADEPKYLIEYPKLGPDALLSVPTPDHYLPLLYVIATRQQGDVITFPVEGIDGGSVSMLAVQVG
jgi:4,5-DOPA dioxygenase extradiol